MDQFFTDLGRRVLARWQGENFSLTKFPAIAQEALDERPPAEHVDLAKLIQDFLLEDEQPFQTQSSFGEPELVVYDNPQFYIQILFWLEGTTEIHQHKFSGAFHVLQGSSIHSEFAFEDAQSVSAHLRVGQLRVKQTQLLETGSTERIVSGNGYIHSLFHLESPSLTVVVRTHSDPGTGPQFTYLPPHLGVDPFYNDALTRRRKQLLDVLEQLEDPSYADMVQEMIGGLDFERGFFILQNGMTYLRTIGSWEEVWEAFARKHGPLAAYVAPTLNEIVWRDGPIGLRSSVTDPDHRFFLALLLNVPTREAILDVVQKRFPGNPIDTVMGWAQELSNTSEVGTWILDAEFPQGLAAPARMRPKMLFGVLRYFLEGGRDEGPYGKYSPGELKELREAIGRSSLRALAG